MNNRRYQIRRFWKKGCEFAPDIPIDDQIRNYKQWYRVIDTHTAAPDWDGNTLFESLEVSDCIDECKRLNEINLSKRRQALDEMVRLSVEAGLYDDEVIQDQIDREAD